MSITPAGLFLILLIAIALCTIYFNRRIHRSKATDPISQRKRLRLKLFTVSLIAIIGMLAFLGLQGHFKLFNSSTTHNPVRTQTKQRIQQQDQAMMAFIQANHNNIDQKNKQLRQHIQGITREIKQFNAFYKSHLRHKAHIKENFELEWQNYLQLVKTANATLNHFRSFWIQRETGSPKYANALFQKNKQALIQAINNVLEASNQTRQKTAMNTQKYIRHQLHSIKQNSAHQPNQQLHHYIYTQKQKISLLTWLQTRGMTHVLSAFQSIHQIIETSANTLNKLYDYRQINSILYESLRAHYQQWQKTFVQGLFSQYQILSLVDLLRLHEDLQLTNTQTYKDNLKTLNQQLENGLKKTQAAYALAQQLGINKKIH